MTEDNRSEQQEQCIQAMVWYREEDWDRLLDLFVDGHLLPNSYKDWLKRAEQKAQEIEAGGDVVVKVFIDPITFPAWCRKKGRKMDMHARTELAIEVAAGRRFGSKL